MSRAEAVALMHQISDSEADGWLRRSGKSRAGRPGPAKSSSRQPSGLCSNAGPPGSAPVGRQLGAGLGWTGADSTFPGVRSGGGRTRAAVTMMPV
jgi:hypothetical protein